MFSFLRKKSFAMRVTQRVTLRVALIGVVLVLLTSFFFVSCADPEPDPIDSGDNAQRPVINTQPNNTFWNVFSDTDEDGVTLSVNASVTDGGNLSYQWYSRQTINGNGTAINEATDEEFTLTKTTYTANGAYYLYVVITNTNSEVSGTKTVNVTSNTVKVTVVGYHDTDYSDTHTLPANLISEWESEWGELFTISATEFSSGMDFGEGWSGYKGTIVNHRGNAEGTAGYITIQYTQNDWDNSAEDLYYVIYYKNLTDTTVTIAGAGSFAFTDPDFGASGGRSTKEEAEATYTVSAGYFEMGSDLVKPGEIIVPAGIQMTSQADMEKIGVAGTHPLSGTYVLMNNITLSNWTPIGDAEKPFTGKFHGYGKTITLNSFDTTAVSEKTYLGIFGYVKGVSDSAKAEIKNLTIASSVNASSTAAQGIGLLAGYAENVEADNITLSGQFTFESPNTLYLGGVVGLLRKNGTVLKNSNSSLEINISPGASSSLVSGVIAYDYVGGFVGLFYEGAGIENCHNTGNITVDNTTNSKSGQVFVGGITGGSAYAFDTSYKGYIQDCSYIGGTVIGKAKGSWTFVGGIAGTIVGGNINDDSITTRIERCFVKDATISVEGTSSGFPYIGGIVGYNYYGALVSQSYFSGTVIADKTNDYTGGIAGYNSQTTSPNNSRIEDCWSSGEVRGFNNAGGIVGQNQVNTYIRRCYSTAKVIVTNQAGTGIGGIAGLNASAQTDAITACVALNPSLSSAGTGNNINRVTGTTGGNRSNNYAWSGMTVNPGTGIYTERKGLTEAGGEDCAEKPTQSFYTGLGWNFTNVWKMGGDSYPKLKWQN